MESPEVDVVLHKLESGHWYEAINRKTRQRVKWLTSVSRYTSQAPKGIPFMKWLADKGWEEAERIKREGGIRGTAVHRAQEILANGGEVRLRDFSREVAEHIVSYANWYEDYQPQFVATEEIVYDLDQGLGGTFDLLYVIPADVCEKRLKLTSKEIRDDIEGILVLNDLKTGRSIYPEALLQVNKYAFLKNNMGPDPDVGVPIEWVSILRTNSKHKRRYEFVIEPICENRLRVFDCLKEVVDYLDPQKEPWFPKPLPETVQLYCE